jgi:hypothetical protein
MSEIVTTKVSEVEKKMYKRADQSLIIAMHMGNETIELFIVSTNVLDSKHPVHIDSFPTISAPIQVYTLSSDPPRYLFYLLFSN